MNVAIFFLGVLAGIALTVGVGYAYLLVLSSVKPEDEEA